MQHLQPDMHRRTFLNGVGGLALANLLKEDGVLKVGRPHKAPKAKAVIQLFMSGAASQCDMFDYKPRLIRDAGEAFDPGGKVELFQSSPGVVMPSPWSWKQYGESGKWMSSLVPHLASCVDDIAFLPGMVSSSNVHGPATFLQTTGFVRPGFPSMGSWLSYGLGSGNQDLPTFVCLPDARGYAPGGPKNWSSGFLPATHQGTMIRPGAEQPIANLELAEGSGISTEADAQAFDLLHSLNSSHASQREGDSMLKARLRSYELAARLQTSSPEALELSTESPATRALYGVDDEATADFGRRCLVARRLVERGVRFIQIWSGADNGFPRRNWDSHEDLAHDHGFLGREMDRPAAALIKDLKARGLLDETIVLWTTEFGRMPCSQGSKGRDHNPFGFTNWLAGGGIQGGVTHGATDEWSFRSEENPTHGYDVHATILHLLGLDHEQLTFRHDGIERRLTDVHGHVLNAILT